MPIEFKDYFSNSSANYSEYRPHYPSAIFEYLALISHRHDIAWDCATGSGQSATALGDYFSNVIATDASAAQISNAKAKTGVHYRVANAERSGIDDASVNLITVSQALHWFDINAFTAEVSRVLVGGGLLAVWSYNLLSIEKLIDEQLNRLYAEILGDYWPKERVLIERGYRDFDFPFQELEAPEFVMTVYWDLAQLLGYLRTWSATRRYEKNKGVNPVALIQKALSEAWGEPAQTKEVELPLVLRIWRK